MRDVHLLDSLSFVEKNLTVSINNKQTENKEQSKGNATRPTTQLLAHLFSKPYYTINTHTQHIYTHNIHVTLNHH